jgi:hypothetical protein
MIAAAFEGASGSAGRTESTSPTRSTWVAGRVFQGLAADPGSEENVMRQLPQRPDLDQLRRRARELLRAAVKGERGAVSRINAVAKPLMLSSAQLAIAREYGFASWTQLKAEVDRRRAASAQPSPHVPRSMKGMEDLPPGRDVRNWLGMREWSAELLERRTGRNVEAWNRMIGRRRFRDQAALRRWLSELGVTGYAQMLLVWERFGYPDFMTAGANDLIGRQYADRASLRPILDATLAALPGIAQVAVVQARKTYISLVSKRRTFAVVQATTKKRVDLGLRLITQRPGGRLKPGKGVGNGSMTVCVPLASPADLDDEALGWLKRAYDENA